MPKQARSRRRLDGTRRRGEGEEEEERKRKGGKKRRRMRMDSQQQLNALQIAEQGWNGPGRAGRALGRKKRTAKAERAGDTYCKGGFCLVSFSSSICTVSQAKAVSQWAGSGPEFKLICPPASPGALSQIACPVQSSSPVQPVQAKWAHLPQRGCCRLIGLASDGTDGGPLKSRRWQDSELSDPK
ncbi:hypothetical protein BKA65DRAFT_478741 [Rhexocercosporidium sp. MPI-PUGE-AT-0058]|nr:hypothetical protein BKA65DRAFT_478741 [Rhexocercosporidium sp. MPI-PUGE-AT-0058]